MFNQQPYGPVAGDVQMFINIIKIEGEFSARLPGSDYESALLEVLLGTARRFGFFTRAEAIESAAQFAWLQERGCTYGQGYVIAPPMDFAALTEWLRTARLTENSERSAIRPPA